MTRIRNLTGSPYDLPGLSGPVILPAFGEITGEFDGIILDILSMSQGVEIMPDDNSPAEDANPETGPVNPVSAKAKKG